MVFGMIGDIVSSGLNWFSQERTNEQNVDLWREQMEYNRPVNQVARWREAGLNPNLIYGQGTSGNVQNLPKQEAPSSDLNFMRELVASEQVKNLKEQNKNLQAQNARVRSETEAQDLENKITQNRISLAERNGLPYDLPTTLLTISDILTGQSAALSEGMQQRNPFLNLVGDIASLLGRLNGTGPAPVVRPKGEMYYDDLFKSQRNVYLGRGRSLPVSRPRR